MDIPALLVFKALQEQMDIPALQVLKVLQGCQEHCLALQMDFYIERALQLPIQAHPL
jgi:hypothetical protein